MIVKLALSQLAMLFFILTSLVASGSSQAAVNDSVKLVTIKGAGTRVMGKSSGSKLAAVTAVQATVPQHDDPVLPDVYGEPGRQPTRDYLAEGQQEHIDPFGGQLHIKAVDMVVPGNGGLDIKIERGYSISNATYGVSAYHNLGLGWTMHMGRVVMDNVSGDCIDDDLESTQGNPVLEMPDGSRHVFFNSATLQNGSPSFQTNERWKAECGPNFTGFIVTSPNGVIYDMTQRVTEVSAGRMVDSWYVKKITDRFGNFISINYANTFFSEIATITASDGRLIKFSYYNSGAFNARLKTVRQGETGAVWEYGYSLIPNTVDDYFLSTVTRPDGRKWAYEYYPFSNIVLDDPNNYLLKRVAYPQAGWAGTFYQSEGFVEYAYKNVFFNPYEPDFTGRTRAVATKKTFGSNGGTWTFNYRPGAAGEEFDYTDVTAPDGVTTYKHYGLCGLQTNWGIGLLREKRIGDVQVEEYEWAGLLISREDHVRVGPGMMFYFLDSHAPVLVGKTITRNSSVYKTTYSNFDPYGNAQAIYEAGPLEGNRTLQRTFKINTAKWIVNQLEDETLLGTSVWDELGKVDRTIVDGKVMEEVRDGIKTNFTYTTEGDLFTRKNGRGKVWTYENYKRGIPRNETWPGNILVSRVVHDAGTISSETDGEGKTMGYQYDGLNRLRGVTPPLGNPVSIDYLDYDRSRELTRGNFKETRTFDRYGRPSRTNSGGIVTTMRYNAMGYKIFESYPDATLGTSYSYDMLGRVRTVTNGGDSSKSTTTYDGNKTSVLNERNKTTVYTYRAYGDPSTSLLMDVAAPIAGASIAIQRNGRGQVTEMIQNGLRRAQEYWPITFSPKYRQDPEYSLRYAVPDAAGNITSIINGYGSTDLYSYDDVSSDSKLTQAAIEN